MTEALKVLIIEDDPDVALGCEQALQLEGIATECAGSAEQARRRLGRDFRGVVVSDIRLPKMDGMAIDFTPGSRCRRGPCRVKDSLPWESSETIS